MNKLFTKIVGATLGFAMAIGVGVAVSNANREVSPAHATDTATASWTGKAIPSGWSIYKSNGNAGVSGTDYEFSTASSSYLKMWGGAYIQTTSTIAIDSSETVTVNVGAGTFGSYAAGKHKFIASLRTSAGVAASDEVTYSFTAAAGSNNAKAVVLTPLATAKDVYIRIASVASSTSSVMCRYYSSGASYTAFNTATVDSISITESDQNLDGVSSDYSLTLHAALTYSNGTGTGCTWSSSDTNVATINATSGAVTLVGNGTTTITATSKQVSTADSTVRLTDTITITVSNFVAEKGSLANPYTPDEAIALMDEAGSGNVVQDLIHVQGTFNNGTTYNSTYSQWEGSIAATSHNIIVKATNDSGVDVGTSDGAMDGKIVIIRGYVELYNGNYQLSYLPAAASPTSSAFTPSIVSVKIITPTKTLIEWKSEKGTYYTGGSVQASYRFSTNDISVRSADNDNNVKDSYLSGIGYTLKIYKNATLVATLDASTEAKTYDFNTADATSGSVAWTIKATIGELTESVALTLNVVAKAPQEYTWTTARTAEYYAHRDTFSNDGVLKLLFNDTGYTTSWNNFRYSIHTYDENADNHLGSTTTIPTHTNGTINLSSQTKYVINYWHKDYESGLHTYSEITVKIPTLTIADNYEGNYYVGAAKDLDVTVTPYYGETAGSALDSSDYVLKVNSSIVTSVTPENTNAISVYATWVIDETEVLTTDSALVINPVVSTRTLGDMAISDQTFAAGELFVLDNDAIMIEVTENEVDDIEYLNQGLVTFVTEDDVVLTPSTRLLKSYAGTVTATYSEGSGVGKTSSTTFTLTVNDPVIESYTAPVVAENATAASSISVGDTVWLVCSGQSVQFNGVSSNIGQTEDYTTNIDKTVHPLEVVAGSTTGKYAFYDKTAKNYLSYSVTGNKLNTETGVTATSSWTVTFSGTNAVIVNASSTTRNLIFNTGSPRFACYASTTGADTGYAYVQLFKCAVTPGSGNPVTYLKSVIDYYRLKGEVTVSGQGLSVCSAGNSIFGTSDWTKAKSVFNDLTTGQLEELDVQDYFGEVGKTYKDTYEWLIAKDPASQQANKGLIEISSNTSSAMIIVIISMISITAIAGYMILRKKKEQ